MTRLSFLALLREAVAIIILPRWTSFWGETAGVVVVANEVVAALENKRLVSPSRLTVIVEELGLIVVSTLIIGILYWRPIIRDRKRQGVAARCFFCLVRTIVFRTIHFFVVVLLAVVTNAVLLFFIAYRLFKQGELVDPITPLIATFLDIAVGVCSSFGREVEMRAKLWVER